MNTDGMDGHLIIGYKNICESDKYFSILKGQE